MAQQWGTGQPTGFQYPAQTGYPSNAGQFNPGYGGIAPQPTGFPSIGQRPVQFQQPMQTGFQGGSMGAGLQPQQTGWAGSGFAQQPPPVPPLPSNISSNFRPSPQSSGFPGGSQPPLPPSQVSQLRAPPPPPPQPSFLSSSPGLVPQATGYPGASAPQLIPQMTGFIDPRQQMMSSTFMPANPSVPYAPSGIPQFANPNGPGDSLVQRIQQYNQDQRGVPTAPKMNWTLTRAEKKNYDQIFRAWDAQGTGFISGQMALEVFGQSGLEKNELAKIWALADADNRGKLNLAEFHVAMGLIYRKLNGMEIPDELPSELVPPSSRDLDSSVNLIKDLLKNDTSRPSSTGPDTLSKSKVRSFNDSSAPGAGGRKDGTVYKYSDEDSNSGGYYQSRSRHIDRRNVRVGNESPSQDLDSLRRQLEGAAQVLDRSAEESANRTREDEELDREMDDLRYRVKRIKDDLDYVSRGPKSVSKDEERRKLERDLMHLLHERIPEVQKRIEEREKRREREKREWTRERDRRNDRFGRYDERSYDRGQDYTSRYDYDRDRDEGGYTRGTYDRDRDRDYDRERDYDRDRNRTRDRSRDYDRDKRSYERDHSHDRDNNRPLSPPAAARSPPPPPATLAPPTVSVPPAVPPPSSSPAPNIKSMSRAERDAYIREQAQRRLQERMRALGVVSPSATGATSPTMDTSVEDRLAREKKEAEEKVAQAEKDAKERERARQERLEGERALKEGRGATPTPTTAPPTATTQAPAPALTQAVKPPPPPVNKRAPAPPPPIKRGAAVPRSPAVAPNPPAPIIRAPVPPAVAPVRIPPAPLVPAVPVEDPEEVALREREERLRKQREAREARLRELEREEEEARAAEEAYQARRREFLTRSATPSERNVPPAPAAPNRSPSSPIQLTSPPPPPPPPALPSMETSLAPISAASTGASSTSEKSTNPFSKFMNQGHTTTSPAPAIVNGGTNPFFRPTPANTASTSSVPAARATPPPASKSPAPKASYQTAPASDDDWGDANEIEEEDSSDDEIRSSRNARNALAQQLFGSSTARPRSAGAGSLPSQPQTPAPVSATSTPPPVIQASLIAASTSDFATAPSTPVAPPPPPPPPTAPIAPIAPVAPVAAPTGDRSALMGSILAGARLKKTVTNDRSAAAVSGQVIGDTAPPAHINAASKPASPPTQPISAPTLSRGSESNSNTSYRQSVDWYAGLAVDQTPLSPLPTMEEREEEYITSVPDIQVHEVAPVETVDLLADVDQTKERRVRSLYPYEGQREEDLSFIENVVIIAYPSKSGGAWWYGTTEKGKKSGFFPSTYVQELENVKAKALYSYSGGNADELPFVEGDELIIVDRSEGDWWKAEQGGAIFIVPAAYLEVIEGENDPGTTDDKYPSSVGLATEASWSDSTHSRMRTPGAINFDESSDEDTGDEEYQSFESDSDSVKSTPLTEEAKKKEHEARELERQRVLEAAGILVKKADGGPPPRPARKKSVRKRRTPPDTPNRLSVASVSTVSSEKDLPATPEPALQVDDAFERYQAYRQSKNYRSSISSIDTGPPSPGLPPAISTSHSKDGEGRSHSHIFNFLYFLSRSKTPESERPQLQISAPILSSGSNGDVTSREENSSFGSSWASLVNKDALEEIPPAERKRQEAIFELINTESAYVRDLQLIVEVFYSSMLSLLDSKEITVIFANIEDILLVNTAFLSSLEERQKDCRLYIDTVGDLLDRHMSMVNMGVYTDYCVNQGSAIKILQSIREKRSDVATHLQNLRENPAVRNLDLSSYLLVPMQRITRYPLLIRQILNYTQNELDCKQIDSALESVESILTVINESIREQEGRDRLEAVSRSLYIGQGRLDLTRSTTFMGPRKLLKEGALIKYKSGRKLRAFLCSDMLVLTDDGVNQLYKVPIHLTQIEVKELPKKDDLAFQLVFAYPRGGETMLLKALSTRECAEWMKAITIASRRAREIEQRAARHAAEKR